ncbi:hypothetical protein E4U55_004552 [Claviceps digitariae]|nr:hypothetical protein E4U55_004552 [Claviceps digitariae]
MARRRVQNRSEDESDPSLIAIEAPKRIFELKKERDERAKAIVVEAEKELASVRQQAMDFQKERRRERSGRRAQNLKSVRDLVDQRKAIELKMLEVVNGVHNAMQEVEEMMLAGFEGRSDEAKQSLEALGEEALSPGPHITKSTMCYQPPARKDGGTKSERFENNVVEKEK